MRAVYPVANSLRDRLACAAHLLPFSFCFCIGEFAVRASAQSEEALAYLRLAYSRFEVDGSSDKSEARILIFHSDSTVYSDLQLELASPHRTGFLLFADSYPFLFSFDIEKKNHLNYYASRLVRMAAVEYSRAKFITIHAACFSVERIGVLLVGEAASGKTSATIQLVEDFGALYSSDDTVAVERNNFLCRGMPLPFLVRDNVGPDITILNEGKKVYFPPADQLADIDPSMIMFLGESDTVDHIEVSESVVRLMGNVVQPFGGIGDSEARIAKDFDACVDLCSKCQTMVIPRNPAAIDVITIIRDQSR